MRYILGCIRRCVDDFDMIEDGDSIAVGVSGGKDSMILLKAMHMYQYFSKKKFELSAITIDLGMSEDFDTSIIKNMCDEWDIPYYVKKTNIGQVVFEGRKEKNPCSLCSKMRRGTIHDVCKQHGINKIALGHHRDDVVQTFLMSLLYEGRVSTFSPLTWMDRADIVQIRPMIYVPENFAHAFLTLEDNSEVYYMVTQFYNSENEGGLRYSDPEINIEWPIEISEISDKDNNHPNFSLKQII